MLAVCAIVVLLAIVAAESFLLYQDRAAQRAIRAQSGRLLTQFLAGDTTQTPEGRGVYVRLQNVRFKWSDKVWVDADNMAVRAVPVRGNVVDFDDLNSFVLAIQQSGVLVHPEVLEGMLNESVFNYPESRLRDLRVTLAKEDVAYAIKMSGRVNVVAWIPFSMVAFLSVDRATNTLVMTVNRLKVFGFLPATKLVRWTPFHLDRLITMPPNQSLRIDGNRIMIKPFGLFPPPRVTGRISGVTVDGSGILLHFAGAPIPAPQSAARNYVYLRGGTSRFGNFGMVDTDVLIQDGQPADRFAFSLQHYASMIPHSEVEVHDTKSVRVVMPDYR
jgi:hypothetical protein